VFPEELSEGFDQYDAETQETLMQMKDALNFLVEGIAKVSAVVPNDRLKDFLPECFMCNLVITLNLRELRHIYKLRTSPAAWKPFRELCESILQTLPQVIRDLVLL
jgi:thymidylate synthase ThyX